ncbi:MAG TPA: endopeptidase La, partial [Trueperaceae bacterium]|nr:endopeptidase La [Trueperaceae bacterium]
SALTGVPVRKDVSMTGEITLRGRVLPIGGLKEKILGAKRAGIKHIVFPAQNEADMKDIGAHLTKSLTMHPVADLDQVLDVALVGGLAALEAHLAAANGGSGNDEKPGKPKRKRSAAATSGVRA